MNWIDFDLHRTHVLENMSKHLNLKLKDSPASVTCSSSSTPTNKALLWIAIDVLFVDLVRWLPAPHCTRSRLSVDGLAFPSTPSLYGSVMDRRNVWFMIFDFVISVCLPFFPDTTTINRTHIAIDQRPEPPIRIAAAAVGRRKGWQMTGPKPSPSASRPLSLSAGWFTSIIASRGIIVAHETSTRHRRPNHRHSSSSSIKCSS